MSSGAAYSNQKYYAEESSVKKVKRISAFQRWIWKYVKAAAVAEESDRQPGVNLSKSRGLSIDADRSIDQPERAIQFTVYNASGGRVVETRRYDRKTDRNTNGLYVITSEQDFGKEIDKIITMEALKQ